MEEMDRRELVLKKATELGKVITGTNAFIEYSEANSKFKNSPKTFDNYNNYVLSQRELQIQLNSQQDSTELVEKLKSLEKELLSDEIFNQLLEKQNVFVNYLKELNSEISSKLMFDFASLAK